MNQFFGTQYSKEDLQQRLALRRQASHNARSMSLNTSPQDGSNKDMDNMIEGDSLDDIIMQNNKEMQRRQSFPAHYGDGHGHDRRNSMMEFGSNNRDMSEFQFGTSSGPNGMSPQQSVGKLDMSGFGDLSSSMLNGAGYTAPMHGSNVLAMDTTGSFSSMPPDMMGNMGNFMGFPSMGLEGMDGDGQQMDLFDANNFSTPEYAQTMTTMPSNFSMPMITNNNMGISSTVVGPSGRDEMDRDMLTVVPGLSISDQNIQSAAMPFGQSLHDSVFSVSTANRMTSTPPIVSKPASPAVTVSVLPEPKRVVEIQPSYGRDVYSTSGFDMLGALMRVATRKNPEINIGAVDMSCAFVVCDVTQGDCPIVYVSDIFERLTGYNKHEVLGRNCRFLQAPDGKVMTGVKRKYVDDDSVYYLKRQITAFKEAQRSLINYRKGGQPFMNLLTMIPISWDSDEIKYFVGFQVDLVDQPGSVAGKGSGGSYTVNYSQSSLPRYVFQPAEQARNQQDAGHTMSRDDVSSVLKSAMNGGPSDMAKRVWDKVLLENSDDVVHVLSLKGLFLYLSPSSKHVLEYDASELVGTALSSVCHPSDIVPVTRELKDTSTGATVNVVFRIRRKKSGYTWFESHGSLCVEQGKGRKCIILVGRERPVYTLGRQEIDSVGGVGENELWTKLSTSGMFLFVSSNVRALLDRQPEDLIGTSIQALMRPESKAEFGRCLERVRTGKRVVFKHEIMNKRGQVLQAQTSIYPGDAQEGSKPTFLVGQTRLLKAIRATAPAMQSSNPNSLPGVKTMVTNSPSISGSSTMASIDSGGGTSHQHEGILTQAGGGGLTIGSQDAALASEDNIFDELKTTRCTSWQFELRQMEKSNRLLSEELASLLSSRKKRKRRKGAGHLQRDCANCHTRVTPEWRRGPSGQRDLCNSCGLRWAKTTGRVSPRTSSRRSDGDGASKKSTSPQRSSPLQHEASVSKIISHSSTPNLNPNPNKHAHPSMNPALNIQPNAALSAGGATMAGGSASNDADAIGGKRSTMDSQPVHAPSQGFKDGGANGITKIIEADEPA